MNNNHNLFRIRTNAFIAILFVITLSHNSFSQSVSGNVMSNFNSTSLGYANVDIYQDGKLVANVLTDHLGNFHVKLDTGRYECKITYAGYETITKEIMVLADEKTDFSMDADKTATFTAYEMESVAVTSSMRKSRKGSERHASAGTEDAEHFAYDEVSTGRNRLSGGVAVSNMWKPSDPVDPASSGKLTAGEVNDFSKWEMWKDLSTSELQNYTEEWSFSPAERYSVQVRDSSGLPLSDVTVELISNDRIIYRAKTDNTGKAELWGSLNDEKSKEHKTLSFSWRGNTQRINKAKPFDKGLNFMMFDAICEQPVNVDIAFVVDATGSMSDELNYLKYDINDVVFRAMGISNSLNFRFANIFYRDHGDAYLTSIQDFTRILTESQAFTNRHTAGGGGDYPEAVDVALDSAINRLSWSEEARARILFLVLDAPPHNNPQVMEKMLKLASDASAKGIRIVVVTGSGTNKSTEYLMRCMALATNGTYTFLTNHSGIGNPHIEPSTDNYLVEMLNDLLTRIIQSYTYMPDCQQYIPELELNLPDSVVVIDLKPDSVASSPDSTMTPEPGIQWKYYPNPTDGIVFIESNVDIPQLYISDLSGKAIMIITDIKANQTTTIDLSTFASGIYLIRYPTGKQWVNGKIVLTRN
jgi:hypothetical protein